ncbi:MAG: hypothetical protein ACOC1K_00770 [Nanoarchaeota archaeon]
MNRDKRDNLKSILVGLESTAAENTSGSINNESKANKVELKRLQEENRKLRETIVELAVELYCRKN